MDVVQDSSGYLWLLNFSSGLLRYDGVEMTRFGVQQGLPDLYLFNVVEDKQGYLWVSCGGGVAVSEKPIDQYPFSKDIRFVRTVGNTTLFEGTVKERCMVAHPKRGVWLGTRDGRLIHQTREGDGASLLVVDQEERKRVDARVLTVFVCSEDDVFVGIEGGLARYSTGEQAVRMVIKSSQEQSISEIYQHQSEDIWVGTFGGHIGRLKKDDGDYQIDLIQPRLHEQIVDFCRLKDGRLMVVSYGEGMLIVDPLGQEPAQPLNSANGLLGNATRAAYYDREGNLWVAQNQGLSKLRSNWKSHIHYTHAPRPDSTRTIPPGGVQAVVTPIAEGLLPWTWVGTEGGGIAALKDDGQSVVISQASGLSSDIVNAARRDSQGQVWFGTSAGIDVIRGSAQPNPMPGRPDRALEMMDNQTAFLTHLPTANVDFIKELDIFRDHRAQDKDPAMFVLTRDGVIVHVADQWFFLGEETGIEPGDLYSVALDPKGRLLLGTLNRGLLRSRSVLTTALLESNIIERNPRYPDFVKPLRRPVFEQVWGKPDVPTNHVRSLALAPAGLFIGTASGLYIVDPETLELREFITGEDGIGADNITSMVYCPNSEKIWLGTNGGLNAMDGKRPRLLDSLRKSDGLVANEVWYLSSVSVGADRRVYFGTPDGLSVYNPGSEDAATLPPKLVFASIDLTQSPLAPNEFNAEYRALSFVNEHKIRYKTRLLGYQSQWQDRGDQAFVHYNNLPAFWSNRTYALEVIATADGETWTPTPLRHEFTIVPPLHLRWYVILVGTGLVIGLFVLLLRNRVRRLRSKNAALQARVDERTSELAQALEQLRNQHQQLLATQNQMVMREQMASLGVLTRGIAHELRNPMNFINNFSQINASLVDEIRALLVDLGDQADGDLLQALGDLQTNALVVHKHGESATEIVNRMLEFSAGGSSEPVRTDLNALVEQYADMAYHGFLSRGGIELVKTLDDRIGAMRVSPQKLGRSVINLMNNALESVSARREHEEGDYVPRIEIKTEKDGDQVHIYFCDNGLGIGGTDLNTLVTPFYTTKSPTGNNVGLGLAMTFETVVEEHGGELKMDPHCCNGACFEIILPKGAEANTHLDTHLAETV